MLKGELARLEGERTELEGYMHKNATQQGEFRPMREDDARLQTTLRTFESIRAEPHAFFPNASGLYMGRLSMWNQTHVSHDQAHERGTAVWNDTWIHLRLHEMPIDGVHSAARIKGAWEIKVRLDDLSYAATDINVAGVHAKDTGMLYLVGALQATPDIRHTLAMIPNDSALINATGQACLAAIDAHLEFLRQAIKHADTNAPPQASQAASNCTLQAYAQLMPDGPLSEQETLNTIERELRVPSGVVTRRAPLLRLRLVSISTRCGMVLETDTMMGKSRAQFLADFRWYELIMLVLVLFQLVCLVQESENIQTHAAIARLSSISMYIYVLADLFFALYHLMLGLLYEQRRMAGTIVVAFIQTIATLAFEMRFLSLIIRQHRQDEQARPPRSPSPTHSDDTDSIDSLSSELTWHNYIQRIRGRIVAAVRTASPITIFGCMYFANVALQFIVPTKFAAILPLMLVMVLSSFWIPQIVHNIRRRSTALRSRTIVAMTLPRCFLVLYLSAYRINLFLLEPSVWAWIIVGWWAAQTFVLLGQNAYGPLFFVPHKWRHNGQEWNWHPTCDELVAMFSTGDEEADSASSIPLGDCPICLMPNELDKPNSLMVAPCHHVFHTECLAPWLEIKQICPSCRVPLPMYSDEN